MVSGLHIPPSPTSHPAFHRCWVDFEITEAEDTKAGESRLHDPLCEGAARSETPSPFFRGASGCPRVGFPQSPLGVPLCPHGTLWGQEPLCSAGLDVSLVGGERIRDKTVA